MIERTTRSAAETEAFGALLAGLLSPGDVVLLRGELGAGKTTLVRGACRSLGIDEPMTSPTFTIGHLYQGAVTVAHLDLYRFKGLSNAEWGDLEPYFDGTIAFVEWPEAGHGALPPARVTLVLEHVGPDERRISADAPTERCSRIWLVLILAFDTATDLATSALVADGVLGERVSEPRLLLADVDELLAAAGLVASDLTGIVVGTGPGSFTGMRIGLSVARGLGLALGVHVAGVSTLDALAAGAERAFPVIDARRGEVFVPAPRPFVRRMSCPHRAPCAWERRAAVPRSALAARRRRARRRLLVFTFRTPRFTRRSRANSVRRTWSSRCTSVCPMQIGGSHELLDPASRAG